MIHRPVKPFHRKAGKLLLFILIAVFAAAPFAAADSEGKSGKTAHDHGEGGQVEPFLSVDAGADENGVKKIVILPFNINAEEELTHIREGIVQMFTTRLFWKDRVAVADKRDVNRSFEEFSGLSKARMVKGIAREAGADYVLYGSITEFGGAFSLDAAVYDAQGDQAAVFYTQASAMDRIIPELSLVAARISKTVFDRTTETYARIEEKEVMSEQKLKRMNPEKMMPYQQNKAREKDKPFWMFWKFWD